MCKSCVEESKIMLELKEFGEVQNERNERFGEEKCVRAKSNHKSTIINKNNYGPTDKKKPILITSHYTIRQLFF